MLAATVLTSDGEVATFCAQKEGANGAEKLHPVCLNDDGDRIEPAKVENAIPQGWYVRLVFNELLDADRVEEVLADGSGSLLNTQPVVLRCNGAEVAYDGYYNPAGSHLTNPPGPSLVIYSPGSADDTITNDRQFLVPSLADCEISINGAKIADKDGNQITATGPFTFRIDSIKVVETTPEDEAEDVALDVKPSITFNAQIELASVLNSGGTPRITLSSDQGAVEADIDYLQVDHDDTEETPTKSDRTTIVLTPKAPLQDETTYTLSVSSGIADVAGGTLTVMGDTQVVATFSTGNVMPPDGGVDAGEPDAGEPDAGVPDAAVPDAAVPDAGVPDAAVPDAALPDAA